jgi:hypothetical protein
MSVSQYPKEVLEALERDQGIRFKGAHSDGGGDARLCYGATCTWFGSIHETGGIGKGALPCCPHCGGVLFEMAHEGEWWKGIDSYEKEGHPGYRAMWEWQRAQKRCFSLRNGIADLQAAYSQANPRDVE